MLPMPDVAENPTVVGIDPGTVMLGVCTIEFDPITFEPTRASPRTFNGEKLGPLAWNIFAHGARHARIFAHGANLLKLLRQENPVYIASESPFYNNLRPNAFGALKEILSEIHSACIRYSPYTPLSLIDPPTVKKAVGAAGNAKKEGVLEALKKVEALTKVCDTPIELLDEHAIDAMAVAYCLLKRLKDGSLFNDQN